jgi:hypothetical protein
MWGKCGVQKKKKCLGLVFDNPFVVLKTPFCGVKNG